MLQKPVGKNMLPYKGMRKARPEMVWLFFEANPAFVFRVLRDVSVLSDVLVIEGLNHEIS
jgi:hypothetical protein